MRRKLFSLVILAFCCIPALAQNVYLYAECNYTGQTYTLGVGRYYAYQIKVPNDRLASMQIPNGMRVTIYEHDNFLGRSNTYSSNTPCLDASWRNITSSIVVEYDNYNQPGYGQNDYVTFYNDCYQRGAYQVLRPGTYSGAQLAGLKYNISSFTISGNLRVRLFANNEYASGYSTTYDNSASCLPNNLNDKVGSLIIEYKSPQNPNDPGGYGNTSGNYATFYSDCDFNGNALRLMPGRYTGTKLGVLKNAIASVQVPYGLRVTAYTNSDNMFGQSVQITQDISCMDYTMKNRIASLVIEQGYGNNNNGNNNNPNDAVIIYVDDNYRGQSAMLRPGNYATMTEAGNFPDNAISSLYVPDGYRVVLYEYANFSGKNFTITASRSSFFLTSWNDKASSLIVYKDR